MGYRIARLRYWWAWRHLLWCKIGAHTWTYNYWGEHRKAYRYCQRCPLGQFHRDNRWVDM